MQVMATITHHESVEIKPEDAFNALFKELDLSYNGSQYESWSNPYISQNGNLLVDHWDDYYNEHPRTQTSTLTNNPKLIEVYQAFLTIEEWLNDQNDPSYEKFI